MFSDLSRRSALCISVTCHILFTPVSGGIITQRDDDDRLYQWTPFPWQTKTITQRWDDHDYPKYQSPSTSSTSIVLMIVLIPICLMLVLICFIKLCKFACTDEECLCVCCDGYFTYSDVRGIYVTQPPVDPISNVQQPGSSNPYRLPATNSPLQQTISFSNVREDLNRALSGSPHLHEEISSRADGSHSLPSEIEEPSAPAFQAFFTNVREDLYRTMSDSAYLNEEISSRSDEVYSSPSRTKTVEVPSPDRPPEYSAVVSSNLTEHVNFPEVRPVEEQDTPPPKYDENILPKF